MADGVMLIRSGIDHFIAKYSRRDSNAQQMVRIHPVFFSISLREHMSA